MADLFLTWDEAQGEQLPHYCVSCAAPATEWADWRICQTRYELLCNRYTNVDVTLPVCPRHRNLSWFLLNRVVAREILDDGVVLGHVSPGFVQAVWDHRDEHEGRPVSSRRAIGFEGDSEDDVPKSLARRHPGRSRYVEPLPGWSLARLVLVGLAGLFFTPVVLLMACGLLGLLLSLVFD